MKYFQQNKIIKCRKKFPIAFNKTNCLQKAITHFTDLQFYTEN